MESENKYENVYFTKLNLSGMAYLIGILREVPNLDINEFGIEDWIKEILDSGGADTLRAGDDIELHIEGVDASRTITLGPEEFYYETF